MRQIFCDSRDRVSGTTCDFVIQLPETLSLGSNHRGRIDNLRIPLVIPTIQTGTNDTFVVLLGSTSYTVTLPQANYDGPGIAAALQSRLTATAPGGWSVVYDTSNIAMSISCTNPFTITGGTYAAQLMSRPYTQTSNAYAFSFVTVLGIDMMYLSSQNFSSLDIVGPGGAHDTLCAAIVSSPFGSVLDISMPQNVYFNIPAMTTQQLSFQLRNRSYQVLSIVPNISFTLTID
jgi:hypothetical protein